MIPAISYKLNKINFKEKAFKKTLTLSAIIVVVILIAIFFTLVIDSLPSLKALGIGFFLDKTWDPVADEYGALPFLVGTLLTSFLALVISTPFSIAVAIFLGEYYKKGVVAEIFKNVIDLLAGIPSVIYGFWGLFVLVPIVRTIEMKLNIPPYGVGIFTSSVILAIMILPFSVSLSGRLSRWFPKI